MKNCFIIMSSSDVISGGRILRKTDFDRIYHDFLKRAVEEFEINGQRYFNCISRYTEHDSALMKGVVNDLNEADLVIADLTGGDPNVMYELGIRHALRRGTIMVTQNAGEVPNDILNHITIPYAYNVENDSSQNYLEFKTRLHKRMREIIELKEQDSPVLEHVYVEQDKADLQLKNIKQVVRNYNMLCEDYAMIRDMLHSEVYTGKKQGDYLRESIYLILKGMRTKLKRLDMSTFPNSLYANIVATTDLLSDLIENFKIDCKLVTLSPNGFISEDCSVQDIINKKIVDPHALKVDGNVEYITIKDVFGTGLNSLKMYSLNDLKIFIDNELRVLGVKDDWRLWEDNVDGLKKFVS